MGENLPSVAVENHRERQGGKPIAQTVGPVRDPRIANEHRVIDRMPGQVGADFARVVDGDADGKSSLDDDVKMGTVKLVEGP